MTVKELSETDIFKSVVVPCPNREICGVYIGDLLSWVMGRAQSDDAWLTIMSNKNILAVASLADTACIILAEGVEIDDDIASAAEAKQINILSCKCGMYEAAIALGKLI